MTTRSQDRPPQGMEPDARKTTQQSMIAAIGASGAVIAGGVTTFVLLVGVVSFDVWPMSDAAGPGSGTDLTLVELAPEPEPAVETPPAAVPFGSGALVTEPATVVAATPAVEPETPKLASGRDIGRGDAPPTPVAQEPEAGDEDTPDGGGDDGGTTVAGSEEPIPQEPAEDEVEANHDDQNGRPQRPSRPVRPAPPAPAPAPAPVNSGATTVPGDSSGSAGGAGGSGSSGNGNHGGRG